VAYCYNAHNTELDVAHTCCVLHKGGRLCEHCQQVPGLCWGVTSEVPPDLSGSVTMHMSPSFTCADDQVHGSNCVPCCCDSTPEVRSQHAMPRIKAEELPPGTADPITAHLRSYGSGNATCHAAVTLGPSANMCTRTHSPAALLQWSATLPPHMTTCLQPFSHSIVTRWASHLKRP
jgi:hypothetical protein